MLRQFATRAMIPVAVTVTGFVIVCCILLYTFIKNDLVNDTIKREANLAEIVTKSTRYSMLKSDWESLRQIIDNIGEQPEVEHLRIFNKKGLIIFSADAQEVNQLLDKESAGCIECHRGDEPEAQLGPMEQARQFTNSDGEKVLAITAAIPNEPSCYNASCHYHPPDLKLLGTLDIGLSREPLENTLFNLRTRMILFCIMVLILTVGGVSALLLRNIVVPMRRFLVYVDQVQRGDIETEPLTDVQETETLARAFQNMALQQRRTKADLDHLRSRISELDREASQGRPSTPDKND